MAPATRNRAREAKTDSSSNPRTLRRSRRNWEKQMEKEKYGMRPTPKEMAAAGFNKLGESPLMQAVVVRKIKLVKEFLKNGADVNSPSNMCNGKYTVLHVAVYNADPDMVRLLLKYNADMTAQTFTKEGTSLHICVKELLQSGLSASKIKLFLKCFELLWDHGADADQIDKNAKTVRQLLADPRRQDCKEIVQMREYLEKKNEKRERVLKQKEYEKEKEQRDHEWRLEKEMKKLDAERMAKAQKSQKGKSFVKRGRKARQPIAEIVPEEAEEHLEDAAAELIPTVSAEETPQERDVCMSSELDKIREAPQNPDAEDVPVAQLIEENVLEEADDPVLDAGAVANDDPEEAVMPDPFEIEMEMNAEIETKAEAKEFSDSVKESVAGTEETPIPSSFEIGIEPETRECNDVEETVAATEDAPIPSPLSIEEETKEPDSVEPMDATGEKQTPDVDESTDRQDAKEVPVDETPEPVFVKSEITTVVEDQLHDQSPIPEVRALSDVVDSIRTAEQTQLEADITDSNAVRPGLEEDVAMQIDDPEEPKELHEEVVFVSESRQVSSEVALVEEAELRVNNPVSSAAKEVQNDSETVQPAESPKTAPVSTEETVESGESVKNAVEELSESSLQPVLIEEIDKEAVIPAENPSPVSMGTEELHEVGEALSDIVGESPEEENIIGEEAVMAAESNEESPMSNGEPKLCSMDEESDAAVYVGHEIAVALDEVVQEDHPIHDHAFGISEEEILEGILEEARHPGEVVPDRQERRENSPALKLNAADDAAQDRNEGPQEEVQDPEEEMNSKAVDILFPNFDDEDCEEESEQVDGEAVEMGRPDNEQQERQTLDRNLPEFHDTDVMEGPEIFANARGLVPEEAPAQAEGALGLLALPKQDEHSSPDSSDPSSHQKLVPVPESGCNQNVVETVSDEEDEDVDVGSVEDMRPSTSAICRVDFIEEEPVNLPNFNHPHEGIGVHFNQELSKENEENSDQSASASVEEDHFLEEVIVPGPSDAGQNYFVPEPTHSSISDDESSAQVSEDDEEDDDDSSEASGDQAEVPAPNGNGTQTGEECTPRSSTDMSLSENSSLSSSPFTSKYLKKPVFAPASLSRLRVSQLAVNSAKRRHAKEEVEDLKKVELENPQKLIRQDVVPKSAQKPVADKRNVTARMASQQDHLSIQSAQEGPSGMENWEIKWRKRNATTQEAPTLPSSDPYSLDMVDDEPEHVTSFGQKPWEPSSKVPDIVKSCTTSSGLVTAVGQALEDHELPSPIVRKESASECQPQMDLKPPTSTPAQVNLTQIVDNRPADILGVNPSQVGSTLGLCNTKPTNNQLFSQSSSISSINSSGLTKSAFSAVHPKQHTQKPEESVPVSIGWPVQNTPSGLAFTPPSHNFSFSPSASNPTYSTASMYLPQNVIPAVHQKRTEAVFHPKHQDGIVEDKEEKSSSAAVLATPPIQSQLTPVPSTLTPTQLDMIQAQQRLENHRQKGALDIYSAAIPYLSPDALKFFESSQNPRQPCNLQLQPATSTPNPSIPLPAEIQTPTVPQPALDNEVPQVESPNGRQYKRKAETNPEDEPAPKKREYRRKSDGSLPASHQQSEPTSPMSQQQLAQQQMASWQLSFVQMASAGQPVPMLHPLFLAAFQNPLLFGHPVTHPH